MVEGKDFFDGDTKLGVKNIPADAIDKIQVLRNFNEVDAMKGLGNDQDNIAMNIKLKSGKRISGLAILLLELELQNPKVVIWLIQNYFITTQNTA